MPKLFKFLKNEQGVVHFIPLLLILIGIVAGVYLVGHPQIFRPRADTPNIQFSGACVSSKEGKQVLTCPDVQLKILSPEDTGRTSDAVFQLVKTAYAADFKVGGTCDFNKDRSKIYGALGQVVASCQDGLVCKLDKFGENGAVCADSRGGPVIYGNDLYCGSADWSRYVGAASYFGYSDRIYRADGTWFWSFDNHIDCPKGTECMSKAGQFFCAAPGETGPLVSSPTIPPPTTGSATGTVTPPSVSNSQPEGGDCTYSEPGPKCYLGSWRSNVCKYDGAKGVHEYNCQTGQAITPAPRIPAVVAPAAPAAPTSGNNSGSDQNTSGGASVTSVQGNPNQGGVDCQDNPPGERPAGYRWTADCGLACNTNNDCPRSKSGYVRAETSNWCYGFRSGSRCLMLQYEGEPRGGGSAAPVNVAPTSTPRPGTSTPTPTSTARPTSSPTANPTASPQSKKTVSYRLAEDLPGLSTKTWVAYAAGGITVPHTFGSLAGRKFIFVEFKFNDDSISNPYQANIDLISPESTNVVTSPLRCENLVVEGGVLNAPASATVSFSVTDNTTPAELKIWVASNKDMDKGAGDVSSWTSLTTISIPENGKKYNFTLPPDLTVGYHAILMTLHGPSGLLLDGNPGGKVNAKCTSRINISPARNVNEGARVLESACTPQVTECGCGNEKLGREKEDPGKCYPECGGGWCKGNPSSQKGGVCETCSAQ